MGSTGRTFSAKVRFPLSESRILEGMSGLFQSVLVFLRILSLVGSTELSSWITWRWQLSDAYQTVLSMWVTDKHCHMTRNKYLKSEDFCKVRTNRKPVSPNTLNIKVIQQWSKTSKLFLLNCLHRRRLIMKCKQNSSSEHWVVRKNRRWVGGAPSSPSHKREDTSLISYPEMFHCRKLTHGVLT